MTSVHSSSDFSESHPSGPYATPSLIGRMRVRRLAPWIAGTLTLLLLIATLTIGWLVRRSLRQTTQSSIESMLDANVHAMTGWLQERRNDVQQCANHPSVRLPAQQLLIRYGDRSVVDSSSMADDDQIPQLSQAIDDSWESPDYLGWCLVDSRGRVIACNHNSLVAQTLPIAKDTQERIDQSIGTVSRPFKTPAAVFVSGRLSRRDDPLMIAISPVREGVRSIGFLGLLIDPLDKFCSLLQVAPYGETGETYAFDRQGTLITHSRFENQLRSSGLLATDQSVVSPLNITARNPGVDTTRHNVKRSTVKDAPLTKMADHATRGADGTDIDGYLDYRGVTVVGSWRWLPEYDIGVTTKIDYAEAYQPMRVLRNSLIGLIGLVGLASIGLFTMASVLRWFADHGGPPTDPARRLGQYNLGKMIGSGGMGRVYHGQHELLRRDVAVKVLEVTEVTPRSLKRFEREVRLTAQLRHPNTIDIYDYGRTPDGTFFYVMEYVDGISLLELIHHYGRQPAERVIYLLLQLCGSLSEAHKKSMVHRDVKPANILVTAQAGLYDMIKVLDFGLVKDTNQLTVELTQVASITGTPLYMSPESVRDASTADQRSDIYSVGAVGYHLLTGKPTFDGENPADICAKQLHEEPVRPDERIGMEFPEDLQNLLMACLRKDPKDRPSTMDELAQGLLHCSHARRWSPTDACQWWEEVYEGPRDENPNLVDNKRAENVHDAAPARHSSSAHNQISSDSPPVRSAEQSTGQSNRAIQDPGTQSDSGRGDQASETKA
ncbi:MAG: serine/threonine protein kinase [Pirellulaceae bacterium]|nr:serine/threonine protein kinase [Pirellulaceae bacterium]